MAANLQISWSPARLHAQAVLEKEWKTLGFQNTGLCCLTYRTLAVQGAGHIRYKDPPLFFMVCIKARQNFSKDSRECFIPCPLAVQRALEVGGSAIHWLCPTGTNSQRKLAAQGRIQLHPIKKYSRPTSSGRKNASYCFPRVVWLCHNPYYRLFLNDTISPPLFIAAVEL